LSNPVSWIGSLPTVYSFFTSQPTANITPPKQLFYTSVHDHLISAVGSQKVSCLCLLDLSAAFDIIDHDILITRLSSLLWYPRLCSQLVQAIYLSSRCFRVKCETDLSWYTSSCGVPQGSVLGPILFVMYTTPFSTLISSCSLNHHFYADDTQLFLSFLPTHLDSSIDPLHDALDRISSWMTANLLTLYSSKTEFLLIGPSKQLAKINNSSFTVPDQCQPRLVTIICPSPLTYAKQRPITASQSSRYDMLAIFFYFLLQKLCQIT